MTDLTFPPAREAALHRLAAFLPKAGRDYAAQRNYDRPGHADVSRLSPYLRHRIITEEEVLRAVLDRWAPGTAEKFIQEVVWRTYWKGWLEMRPAVWTDYRAGVQAAWNRVQTESGLRRDWEAACRGETGIDGFDAWAHELAATGYLHNHARMWFASIWIFTLRLPWELGADFFLRHLLDGCPASNTLGWRWVAGLQTPGKHYVATCRNISKYTEGRHRPEHQLNQQPAPLEGPENPPAGDPPEGEAMRPGLRTGLLLHEDDLSADHIDRGEVVAVAAVEASSGRSPLAAAPQVRTFTRAAVTEACGAAPLDARDLRSWIEREGLEQIVTPYAPVGPAAELLGGLELPVPLVRALRPYDARAWPHAARGFFRFKKRIPDLLAAL